MGIAIILSLYLLREINNIYKLMYVACFFVLEKSFYEIVWQYLALGNVSMGDMIQVALVILPMAYFWKQHKILSINKLFICMLLFEFIIFGALIITGWFVDYKLYHMVIGNDPHNWLWGLSRTNGTFMWLALIRRKT
jgi:hypothetical protein